MSRPLRIDFAGARHHVMNRTGARGMAFVEPEDHALFIRLLAELPGRFGVGVHGWALMGNHFHLLLSTGDARLAETMTWLGGGLARELNQRRGWNGPLFRSRYRNRVVLDETYWRGVLAYIHLNPMRAGRVSHPDEGRWTSHRAYAGLDPAPPWLERSELLESFGGAEGYRATLDDYVERRRLLPPELQEGRLWEASVSDAGKAERVPPAATTLTLDDALGRAAAVAGVSVAELYDSRRGRRGNAARALAAWWLGRAAGMSRDAIGERLAMSPSAVGTAAYRVRRADGELGRQRDALLRSWWE